MAIKIHTCPNTWIHGAHPCWQVMKALDESGVPYEQVKEPLLRGRRTDLEALSGQRRLPVLELDDGTVIRKESKDMSAMVRAGELGPAAAT